MSNQSDPSTVLFYDATSRAKMAVTMEQNNQLSSAIQAYNDAVIKAQTAISTGLPSQYVPTAQNLIARASNRAAELSSLAPGTSLNLSGSGNSLNLSGSGNSLNLSGSSSQINRQKPIYTNSGGQGANPSPAMNMSSAIVRERPNLKFADVSGLEAAKTALYEAVIMPLQLPKMFTGPTKPWRGILLYGPPGTGKSFLAKALAGECNDTNFLTVSTADLTSKWVGESEKLIKGLFETARANRPAVIFIDEIDSICSSRRDDQNESSHRMMTEFLIQMDGFSEKNDGVVVVGATNLPWNIDTAMRRRFEKRIYIPLPDQDARLNLIQLKLKGAVHNLSKSDIQNLAKQTKGYSGADISILIRDALMLTLRELQTATSWVMGKGIDGDGKERNNLWLISQPSLFSIFGSKTRNCKWDELPKEDIAKPVLEMRHLQTSLSKVKPTVAKSDLVKYQMWTKEFGEDGT